MEKTLTHEQILKAAIEKAVKNGYTPFWQHEHLVDNKEGYMSTIVESIQRSHRVLEILYSHDFAKAFWGERDFDTYGVDFQILEPFPQGHAVYADELYYDGQIWQYHLQIMVLEPDPIKYLEKFI